MPNVILCLGSVSKRYIRDDLKVAFNDSVCDFYNISKGKISRDKMSNTDKYLLTKHDFTR